MRYDATRPHIRHRVHNPFRQDAVRVCRAAWRHSVVTSGATVQVGESLPARIAGRGVPGPVVAIFEAVESVIPT
jgi:hypothetical protein